MTGARHDGTRTEGNGEAGLPADVAARAVVADAERALKRLLKVALRTFGFKSVSAERIPP